PSRTHREVILQDIAESERNGWHDAASRIIEAHGGKLASAEAARHAALSGNQTHAVELALVAAKLSRDLQLDAATEALLAFAGASPSDIAPSPTPGTRFRLDAWVESLQANGDREGGAGRLVAIAA